jgi:signal transduction histidine kinase
MLALKEPASRQARGGLSATSPEAAAWPWAAPAGVFTAGGPGDDGSPAARHARRCLPEAQKHQWPLMAWLQADPSVERRRAAGPGRSTGLSRCYLVGSSGYRSPCPMTPGPRPAYCAAMSAVRGRNGARPTPRPRLIADGVLAAGLAAFLTGGTYATIPYHHAYRSFDVGAVVLLITAAAILAWRRRYPVPVTVAAFVVTLAYFLLGYPDGPIWLSLIVAGFTAAVRGHRLAAAGVAVASFAVFPWLDYLARNAPAPSAGFLAGLAAWILLLLGAAEFVRFRRERAAAAARIREEETLRRASEERLRIARELHDTIGHHLSLINVQSGVALHLGEELPEQARSSFSAIKQASKEALAELRSVLSILRQEDEPAPRAPAPTLARLDDLVAQAATAGLTVRTETEGQVRPLPFSVDAAAFRIIQEALTNVTRHAAPATATATVCVGYTEQQLTIQVDDDGCGVQPNTAADGKGITGMRERVTAIGGEFQAGPRPGGGFQVRARLPLDAQPGPDPARQPPP